MIGTVCIGLLASNAYSQNVEEAVTVDLPCYETKEIFKSLREKFKEMPMLTGKANDNAGSTVSIWINPTDNNWTIVATKKDLSCVIGIGTAMKVVPYRKGVSIWLKN